MKTIAFFNLKGGCGKTTSVINLGYLLAEHKVTDGQKVLLIDGDMQANLTNSLTDYDIQRRSLYHLLVSEAKLSECLIPVRKNIDLLPSSLLLATIEPRLNKIEDHGTLLKRALSTVKDQYEYCLIDCSPSFNTVTINALAASDAIFIPVQTEFYAVDGVHLLNETLAWVNKEYRLKKEITLLFATIHDRRNNIDKIQYEQLKEKYGSQFMHTAISKNIALVEAPIFKESIFEYRPRSKGAQDYQKLFEEIDHWGGF